MTTIGDYIGERVRQAINDAIKDSEDRLKDIAKEGGDAASSGILGDIKTILDILDEIPGLGAIVREILGGPFKVVEAVEGAGGRLGTGFGIGYFIGYFGWELFQPGLRTYLQDSERAFHSQLLDPSQAAILAARHVWEHSHASHEIEGTGIDGDKAAAMIEGAYAYPELAEMMDLLRRGEIDGNDLRFALKRHGVPDVWVERLLNLERNLVTVADLALASLRGVITQDEGRAYAQKLGYGESDFDLLVQNTGEPPGLMELLEAYRRDFIDRGRLERGIRQSRVRNEWIDVVEKLRFSPMSTADAARAVVENYLDSDAGKKIAEQNGLDPDHWKFIVESWGRPLSHLQMMDLYYRGQATIEQVHQAFRESDLKDKYITQSVELGRRLIPERLIVDAIKFGALSTKDGARKLLEHGYVQEDVNILLKLGLSEHKTNVKQFTKTEIVQLYEQRLMSEQDAMNHLEKIGYSQHDAQMELHLADVKAHAAALKLEVAHVRNSFLEGRLSAGEAENELAALGMDRSQARSLLAQWTRERGHASRLLTPKEVAKAFGDKLLGHQEALHRIVALGYTRQDAEILLNE